MINYPAMFKAIFRSLVVLVGFSLIFPGFSAQAIEKPETELQEVGVSPVLGASLDLNLKFTDSLGRNLTLGEMLAPDRATILVPVYYECPRLCGLLLEGLVNLLNELSLNMGEDFRVVTVSFNPADTVKLAADRKLNFIARLQKVPLNDIPQYNGWGFYVGDEVNTKELMKQLGFHYIQEDRDFAHAAALFILTPQGKISQYFTGISFPPRDVRLSLVESSMGAIGTTIDHIMLFCFRFDPLKGKYTWMALRVMQIGGALTLLFLGGLITYLFSNRLRN